MPTTRRRRQQQEQQQSQEQPQPHQSQPRQESRTQGSNSNKRSQQLITTKKEPSQEDNDNRPKTRSSNARNGANNNDVGIVNSGNSKQQQKCLSSQGDVVMKSEKCAREEMERLKTEKLNNECVQKNVLEMLENDLCCAICREVYINPVILNCSHSFCKYCLNAWLTKQDQCPSCRIDTVFHTENLALRELVNKMIIKMPTQYQEGRTETVKARLKQEEIQEKALPSLRPKTRSQNNGSVWSASGGTRELGTRRIQRWTGLNGATIWRTPIDARSRRAGAGFSTGDDDDDGWVDEDSFDRAEYDDENYEIEFDEEENEDEDDLDDDAEDDEDALENSEEEDDADEDSDEDENFDEEEVDNDDVLDGFRLNDHSLMDYDTDDSWPRRPAGFDMDSSDSSSSDTDDDGEHFVGRTGVIILNESTSTSSTSDSEYQSSESDDGDDDDENPSDDDYTWGHTRLGSYCGSGWGRSGSLW